MSRQTAPSDLNIKVCEVFGCIARANTRIVVNVGHEGKLSLFVCEDCASKFDAASSTKMENLD